MEKRIFRTLIIKKDRLGKNVYVHGRISGMNVALCGGVKNDKRFALMENRKVLVITSECTQKQYDTFSELVEKLYPGICVFDYKGSE